jgi:hypothetical protein
MSGSNSSSLWRNTADFLSIQIAAVQGAVQRLINTAQGSMTRALGQADTSVAMYLQNQIIYALNLTRSMTSKNSDLDSFYNGQFNFARLAATYAQNLVTFARATPTYAASIPLSSIVTTGTSGVQFEVIEDTTNAFWDSTVGSSGGYTIPAGAASASVPVEAVIAGITGNVGVGTINTVLQPITYIDTVTNPNAFTNGLPAETDEAYTARFILWINSRSLGVRAAIESAVLGVQQGLTYQIVGNALPGQAEGTTPGSYSVYVDNGTGAMPSSVISLVYAAIDAVNGFTIEFYVNAATALAASISMGCEVSDGYTFATVQSQIIDALEALGGGLSVGQTLPYYSIPQTALDSSDGIELLSNVTLNGSSTADLVPAIGQVIQINSPVVNQVGG